MQLKISYKRGTITRSTFFIILSLTKPILQNRKKKNKHTAATGEISLKLNHTIINLLFQFSSKTKIEK